MFIQHWNGGKQRRVHILWLRVLWLTVKSKHPGMLLDGIILLHDNGHPHTANLVRDKLQRFGWKTLQLPPYRPELSTCDFHIFGDLKKDIHGCLFHSDEVQEWARLWIHQRPTSFCKTGIDHLISQRDKCINTSGNYFWIKQNPLSLCSGCSIFILMPFIQNLNKLWLLHITWISVEILLAFYMDIRIKSHQFYPDMKKNCVNERIL